VLGSTACVYWSAAVARARSCWHCHGRRRDEVGRRKGARPLGSDGKQRECSPRRSSRCGLFCRPLAARPHVVDGLWRLVCPVFCTQHKTSCLHCRAACDFVAVQSFGCGYSSLCVAAERGQLCQAAPAAAQAQIAMPQRVGCVAVKPSWVGRDHIAIKRGRRRSAGSAGRA
jgi:hypothetical protein